MCVFAMKSPDSYYHRLQRAAMVVFLSTTSHHNLLMSYKNEAMPRVCAQCPDFS